MGINLPEPPEPTDIKDFIKNIRIRLGPDSDIDWDSLAVWYLNKLPSYLWRHWKSYLEPRGFSWQKFIKVLKYNTNDIISWALTDEITWSELISEIIRTLSRYITSRR